EHLALPGERLAIIARSKTRGNPNAVVIAVAEVVEEVIPRMVAKRYFIAYRRFEGYFTVEVAEVIRQVLSCQFHQLVNIRAAARNPKAHLIVDKGYLSK